MSQIQVMTERERGIYNLLLEADDAFFVPEDHSDLYGLSPEHLGPGLIRIPGEYTNMNDIDIDRYVNEALDSEKWYFIPLSELEPE